MTSFTWGDPDPATWGEPLPATWGVGPPSAPENLTATAVSDSEIDLSWDNVGAIDGITVYRSRSASANLGDYTQVATLGAVESYSDTGLTNGREFHYRVTATNAVGESDPSNDAFDTTDLTAPDLATDTTTIREVDLSVTLNDNNDEGDVTITRDGTTTVATLTDLQNLTATDTGLLDGTAYDYTATRDTGDATATTPIVSETTILPDEDQPILGNGVLDEVAVDRETAVTNTGDVRYQIRRSEDAPDWETAPSFQQFIGAFDTLTFEFVGLLDGEEYEVRGRTETADATGDFTDPVSIATKFPAITNLAASLDEPTGDVTLTWTDNADNEDGIEVQRRELSTDSGTPSAWQVITTLAPDTEAYTDNVDGGEYEYRLRAFTPYTDSFSDITVTVLRPTQIVAQDNWQVAAPGLIDDETNVKPRIERAAFDVDPVVDTANPFGDYAVFKADDQGGERFDLYVRGERIDIYPPNSTDPRFTGYVVERRENEQAGADVLEVEAYSFDQFLRRNTVTNDQRGNTIAQALADIIQTDTPVTYNAGNVDVGDDQELTRSYQGETVESTLRDLAFKSNNEDFGVNDDLEFFFRERETVHIDRGIDNTQWFNYDIPELGKETINEVEVWFDDGEESVVVDDGTDKLDLQDNLGLPSPGTQRAELNRPLLTDIADAEDVGRKYLAFRNATLSGTVTTFGLYDAEPGDTIDIEIAPRGIDEEFVIAATEYRWGRDETILTIVEKRGDVDDILSELNDSVQRQEMESANRDAPQNRITTTNAAGVVAVDVDADGNTPDGDRFVNDGRRAVRDTWTGEAPPDITTLVVGDDGTGLSRSNTALRNQTNSATVTQALPDAKTVEFTASITQTGVQEVGLEAADGRLITRAVFASPVDLAGDVTVTFTVSNDASVSRGVLTNDGQTAVRDVLADNSPALPNAYAYGDDGTAVSETDSSLGNELVEVSLEEVLIQSEVGAFSNLVPDAPLGTRANGSFETTQINYVEVPTSSDGNTTPISDDRYVDGTGRSLQETGDFIEVDIPVSVDIPSGNVGLQFRDHSAEDNPNITSDGAPPFDVTINGTLVADFTSGGGGFVLGWTDILQTLGTGTVPPDVSAGDTITIRIEATGSPPSGEFWNYVPDVISLYDDRFESELTFDNTVDTAGGNLDGPELYPEAVTQSFTTATTRRNVTEARFDLTANNVSNNFYVELANDGSTFTRINNSATGSVTFASPERDVDTTVQIGRYGGPRNDTPRFGYLGQSIESWELFANPDAVVSDNIGETLARAVVAPDTIVGETIREAGLKSDNTLLTRHEIAEFNVASGTRISSAETTRFTSDN